MAMDKMIMAIVMFIVLVWVNNFRQCQKRLHL